MKLCIFESGFSDYPKVIKTILMKIICKENPIIVLLIDYEFLNKKIIKKN